MQATYRDHGGTDLSVVNAARVSFSNSSDWDVVEVPSLIAKDHQGNPFVHLETRLKAKDVNLINYLARGMPKSEWAETVRSLAIMQNPEEIEPVVTSLMYMAQHWVPFTHTMITLHMVAPVPIARQCFKHKIGFTESEESRRYISGTPNLYIPEEFRAAAENVKQGSGGAHPNNHTWRALYVTNCKLMVSLYDRMIEDGVAPEQARFVLPQGCEVEWIWTGNLASFARYYNQRTDSHAQLESQQLAKQVGEIIRPLFPVSWDALTRSGRTDVGLTE